MHAWQSEAIAGPKGGGGLLFCVSVSFFFIYLSLSFSISGNQRTDLPTCLVCMSLLLHLPCRSPSNFSRLPCFFEIAAKPSRFASILQLPFCEAQNPFQLCAVFEQLNFQKCSEAEVFFTFRLRILLLAAAVCEFRPLFPADGSAHAALANLLFNPSSLTLRTPVAASFHMSSI